MSPGGSWLSLDELLHRLSPAFLERYSIRQELGRGGMGTVYHGTDRRLDREVAIKFLQRLLVDETASARVSLKHFWQEGRAAAKVSHPNLARIFDMGQDGVLAYIVFEYVPGEPLDRVLEREKRLPLDRVLAIGLQILRGLEALHAGGVIHRDIKPSNLMMTDQCAKIIDLGVALADDATNDASARSHVVGSLKWMAPEQILNAKTGPQADLYAVGEVMYRCLTGEPPYTGNAEEIVARKLVMAPSSIRTKCEVPESVAATIDQLMALDPGARPASAREVIDRLTQRGRPPPGSAAGASTDSPAPAGAPGRAARPARAPFGPAPARPGPGLDPRPALALFAGGATLALVLGAWFLGGRGPRLAIVSIERGLRRATVRVHRSPPGPVALKVRVNAQEGFTVPSLTPEADHRIVVAPPTPIPCRITVQPVWEKAAGAPREFDFDPVLVRDATVAFTPAQGTFRFETSRPVRCRLQVRMGTGWTWLEAESAARQSHAFPVVRVGWPPGPEPLLSIQDAQETVEEPLALNPAGRLAYLQAGLDAMVEFIRTRVRAIPLFTGKPRKASAGLVDSLTQARSVHADLDRDLPPRWLVDELGARSGILDSPDVPPERKDVFYRALADLEVVDEIRTQCGFKRYACELLYGRDFGPSIETHYPHARVCPIRLADADARRSFQLVDDPSGSLLLGGDEVPHPQRFRSVHGEVAIDDPERLAHAELHVRANVLRVRPLSVILNGRYEIRLGQTPGKPDVSYSMVDRFTAFDPRYLVPGPNTVEISMKKAPLSQEQANLLSGAARVDPPGLDLRVVDRP